jgi:hypothetical protein
MDLYIYILHDDYRTREVVMFLSNEFAHILHTIHPTSCLYIFSSVLLFLDESIDVVHNTNACNDKRLCSDIQMNREMREIEFFSWRS